MKVLILTGRFGMGHVSVAHSLKEQVEEKLPQAQVQVTDLLEYTAPKTAGLIYGGFALLTRYGRSLYNFMYRQAGRRDENEWGKLTLLVMKKLSRLMEEQQPDIVISTLPLCSLLAAKYKEKQKKNTGASFYLVTCITDISSHSEWIQPGTDLYLTGGDIVRQQLIRKGVAAEQIRVTGIPVGRAFRQAAVQDSWETVEFHPKKRLLIMGGGLGMLPKEPWFYQRLADETNLQVTVITGKNRKLYQELAGVYDNIEVIGYTDQVERYMRQADVVLTKPGGITLFETIFCEKPILMFSPFLQQEVDNMEFAMLHGIGWVLPKKRKLWAEEICRLMNDSEAIARKTICAKQLKNSYRRAV